MDAIWHKSYQPGVPKTIDPDRYSSLVEMLDISIKRYHPQPAFSNLGTDLSFAEFDQLSLQLAAYFQQVLKLQTGDRLAVMMPNILQYPVVVYAALRAGLTIVNVNPMYTPRELVHQLNDASASAIVLLANFAATLEQALPQLTGLRHIITTEVADLCPWYKRYAINFIVRYVKKTAPARRLSKTISLHKAITQGAEHCLQPPAIKPSDIAFLQYTGGTTGIAKGAMLIHRNIMANLLQAEAWLSQTLIPGKEVIVTPLPLYHIFSLLANCLMFIKLGGQNVLITDPRDRLGLIKQLRRYPFTVFSGVNTLFNALLHTPGFNKLDFTRVKLCLGGGMAVQKAVDEAWKTITGSHIVQAYGLTEASPAVCINPLHRHDYNGSIGLPIPSTEVSIQDEQGRLLPQGDVGELCVRGPQVMKGYWQQPDETAHVLSPEGWLHTGDIAKLDEQGYVYIVDRKKDMISVSGFKVFPNEVEEVVVTHRGVLEAAVIGVPSETTGEAIKLFVVRENPTLTKDEIKAFCQENLTAYKVPRFIEFVDKLPKSNVGKILRRELRQLDTSGKRG